jgi:hypothetical protein
MTTPLPEQPSEEPVEQPPLDPLQTAERRAFVRYPRQLEMFWQFLGIPPAHFDSASVFDLSATGVGLIVEREFAIDTKLMIRLPTSTQGWNTHLVRVKNCTVLDDGRYRVGCAFARPLSTAQLRALLS